MDEIEIAKDEKKSRKKKGVDESNESESIESIDPAKYFDEGTGRSETKDNSGVKKKQRKKRVNSGEASNDIIDLVSELFTIISAISGIEELELSEVEKNKLDKATANLSIYIPEIKHSGKNLSIFYFLLIIGIILIPRVILIFTKIRNKEKK